jgi:integrase
VDEWLERAAITEGAVFRPLNKGGRILDGRLSEDTVWNVVREYGARLGKPAFAPHDLRRTCAKLCRSSGGDLEQIQLLLGHASVQAVNDHLPVEPDLDRSVPERKPAQSPLGTKHRTVP